MDTLDKVTAFVISEARPPHLLVFRHPLVGVQLPAGTVEPGEGAVAAAVREVWEETGLELAELGVAEAGVVVGEEEAPLPSGRAVLCETVTAEAGAFERGHPVRVLGEGRDGRMAIREEVYDYGASPPALVSARDAEVPAGCLARRIRRTYVLFVARADIAHRSIRRADGHDFEVFWTPLRPDAPLAERQSGWLTSYYGAIEARLAGNAG